MIRLALMLGALAACHPNLPPVAGCTPGVYACHDGRPVMCSPSQRWEPAGDTTCAAAGGVCVVLDGGSAHCAPATDGGAS